jgi:ligand-binding SRPBCC domain-containing protein
MGVRIFRAEQRVARPLSDTFEFFSRAANLEQITPAWLRFSILGREPAAVASGTVIPYRLRLHGIPLIWVSQIEEFERDRLFVDRQLIGPYKLWHHRHEFEADGDGTVIRDEIRYELPLGAAGAVAERLFVRRDVNRIFTHRREAIERLMRGEATPIQAEAPAPADANNSVI